MKKVDIKSLRLGDRVETVLGIATIVAFETTLSKYVLKLSSSPISADWYIRIVVALDEPKNWILASEKNPHPYMYESDIMRIL